MTARQTMHNPYAKVYARDLFDPDFASDLREGPGRTSLLATYVGMLVAFDGTYPTPAAIEAWADPTVINRLVELGRIDRVGSYHYTIPALAAEREARRMAGVNGTARATSGQFAKRDRDGSPSDRDGSPYGTVLLSAPLLSSPSLASPSLGTEDTVGSGRDEPGDGSQPVVKYRSTREVTDGLDAPTGDAEVPCPTDCRAPVHVGVRPYTSRSHRSPTGDDGW